MSASPALSKQLSSWIAADVQQLIDLAQDEGQRLDYKGELPLRTKSERREAAKDASGMANAQGGLLIYGVGERQLPDGRRIPTAITPLDNGDVQAQLENILYSAVSPTLNLDTHLLPVATGYVLLVRVYQRSGPPHMVVGYDDNRHYVRRGLSTSPMTQAEIETAYAQVAAGEGRLARLIRAVPLVPPLRDLGPGTFGDAASGGPDPAEPWMSLVSAPLDVASGDLIQPSQALSDELQQQLYRIGMGYGISPSAEGYVTDIANNGHQVYRSAIYRNGVVEYGEAVAKPFHPAGGPRNPVASISVMNLHQHALSLAAWIYARQGYFGRVRNWLAIERAEMTFLAIPQAWTGPPQSVTPSGRIEAYTDTSVEGLSHQRGREAALLPIHNFLWQAYGYQRCHLFAESGELRTNVQGLEVVQ